MRICPQCKKEYDDTCKVCLDCSIPIADSAPYSQNMHAEIEDVRKEITKLNEKLNRIEYNLSNKEEKDTEKRLEALKQKVIDKDESVGVEKQFKSTVFKDNTSKPITPPRKSIVENFEQILGEKWFNKLGIFAIVIGVVFLVGYSFRYLGPVGKISIGFVFGLAMFLFGHYIEKKRGFSVYGKSLVGGGWAIAYFTAFAMHHIPAVRLVQSPLLGMVLLLGVSVVTIVDIFRYKSQIATAFSYLLIFIALMISPVSFYTMAAAVPVAFSLIFFMYKMKWLEFGFYGMAMTYITYIAWFKIAQQPDRVSMTQEQFFIAVSFLILYWVIFVIATLLIKGDDNKSVSASFSLNFGMKNVTHIVNTVIASYIGWVLIESGFTKYLLSALLLAAGLYLALTAISYLLKARSLYIISSTFSIIFMAIFFSVKYTGYPLTVLYIILAQTILLAGIILKEGYWRVFSFVFLVVIIGKLLIIDSFIVKNTVIVSHLTTRTLLFGLAFIIYLINHFLYIRLKNKNLLTKIEQGYPVIISYSYPLIYAMGTWLDLPKVLTAPCWIILSVVLLQVGILKNGYHQRTQGYILGVGAFFRLLMSNMLVQGGISVFSYRIFTSLPVLLILYYCVILLQDEKIKNMLKNSEKKMIFIYPYMLFIIVMFLVWYEAPKNFVAPVWGIIAIVYSLRGVYSKEKHYLSISSIAALSACMRAMFVNLFQGKYLVGAEGSIIFPIFTISALYLGNIFYLESKESLKEMRTTGERKIRALLHSSRLIYGIAATALLTALLMTKLQGALLTVSLGIEGMALFLFGFGFKEKYWRIFGLIILLLTLVKAFLMDLRQLSTLYYILSLIALGIALLFVSYIYTKYKDKIKKLI